MNEVLFATKEAIPQASVELLLISAATILAVPEEFNCKVMFLQLATGATSSLTVTVVGQLLEFPAASYTVTLTFTGVDTLLQLYVLGETILFTMLQLSVEADDKSVIFPAVNE